MPDKVIVDTSCLIVLSKIKELKLLQKLYKQIEITIDVKKEFGLEVPEWIDIVSPKSLNRQKILELQIDKGEASVLALALEDAEKTAIIDDFKARIIAEQLGLKITGTIGIIIKAKQRNFIPSVKPYLKDIRKTDFRISKELEQIALQEAKE